MFCPRAKDKKTSFVCLMCKRFTCSEHQAICACSAVIIRSEFCTLNFCCFIYIGQRKKYCDHMKKNLDFNQDVRFMNSVVHSYIAFTSCMIRR